MTNGKTFISPEELQEIITKLEYDKIINHFNLQEDVTQSRGDERLFLTPWTNEKTASLSINTASKDWNTFSGSESYQMPSNGGPLQLVQRLLAHEGKNLNIYAVALWVEENLRAKKEKEEVENKPKADLRGYFSVDHPEFVREVIEKRGISKQTAYDMDFGYLPWSPYPIGGRIVFQVRDEESRIVTHQGRAITAEQEVNNGKYWAFPYPKSSIIYNADKVLNSNRARDDAFWQNTIILVEGCFDAAKLWEGGLKHVIASLGATLHQRQLQPIKRLSERLDAHKFLVWYDRYDEAAKKGQQNAVDLLKRYGFKAAGFDWEQGNYPSDIKDPCDFSVEQLHNIRQSLLTKLHEL